MSQYRSLKLHSTKIAAVELMGNIPKCLDKGSNSSTIARDLHVSKYFILLIMEFYIQVSILWDKGTHKGTVFKLPHKQKTICSNEWKLLPIDHQYRGHTRIHSRTPTVYHIYALHEQLQQPFPFYTIHRTHNYSEHITAVWNLGNPVEHQFRKIYGFQNKDEVK